MKVEKINASWRWMFPVGILALTLILFYSVLSLYGNYGNTTIFDFAMHNWTPETGYEHGFLVLPLMACFTAYAWKDMTKEEVKPSLVGLAAVMLGLLLFVLSVRTVQPRLALFGLPFILSGVVYTSFGWKVARHTLFPAFFLYFAITMPGLQQATNNLQVLVTKGCDVVSNWIGIETVVNGTNIESATGSWDSLKIAEGCSGIRSLIALTMVSAIFAMYTQKELWKKWLVFSFSLPIAIVTNFLRVFTIIILGEMGYGEFAAGVYHDWTGLIVFFPIALGCLFIIDYLLNRKKSSKSMRIRTKS